MVAACVWYCLHHHDGRSAKCEFYNLLHICKLNFDSIHFIHHALITLWYLWYLCDEYRQFDYTVLFFSSTT